MNKTFGINNGLSERTYIGMLRNDRRMRAMFDGWVAQATLEAANHFPDTYDASERAGYAAEMALRLALSFIIDNDGEYQALREQLDRVMENFITLETLNPRPIFDAKGEVP